MQINGGATCAPGLCTWPGPWDARPRVRPPVGGFVQAVDAQLESCCQALSRRLTLTGWGVRSSCAKKLTRSSSSSQR